MKTIKYIFLLFLVVSCTSEQRTNFVRFMDDDEATINPPISIEDTSRIEEHKDNSTEWGRNDSDQQNEDFFEKVEETKADSIWITETTEIFIEPDTIYLKPDVQVAVKFCVKNNFFGTPKNLQINVEIPFTTLISKSERRVSKLPKYNLLLFLGDTLWKEIATKKVEEDIGNSNTTKVKLHISTEIELTEKEKNLNKELLFRIVEKGDSKEVAKRDAQKANLDCKRKEKKYFFTPKN